MENNPFKNLELLHLDVPDKLKQKVLTDINIVTLLVAILNLYTCHYDATLKQFLKTNIKTK